MSSPKVSIIVPVYNVEQYLEKCICSLINQTLSDIEIILIDDKSTDNSLEIIKKYAQKESRIKILVNEKNLGLSASRNAGLNVATADYIMCCDSDDWFEPNMCEIMYKQIIQDKTDIVMCGVNVVYEADHAHKKADRGYFKVKGNGVFNVNNVLITNTAASPCNKIYKRSLLNTYNIRFPNGLKYEDVFFFNIYMLWAKKISFIKDKLYNYRRRAGSIMNVTFQKNTNPHFMDGMYIAERYYEYIKSNNLFKKKKLYFWQNMFINNFYYALLQSGTDEQKQAIFQYAKNFVLNNARGELPRFFVKIFDMIIHNKTELFRGIKYAFGMITFKYYPRKMKIKFIGVPVWQVKTFENRETFYLLSFIPVWSGKGKLKKINY